MVSLGGSTGMCIFGQLVWYGEVWFRLLWYGTKQYGITVWLHTYVWYGTLQTCMVVRTCMVWYVRYGCTDMYGMVW